MLKTAKLFRFEGHLMVRLPPDFRFSGNTVNIRRDPVSGDVLLSRRALTDWASFMALRSRLQPVPEGFLQRSPSVEQRSPRVRQPKK
jgi:antitoxin VapB